MPLKAPTASQPPPLHTNGDLAGAADADARVTDDGRFLEQRWRIFEATLSAVAAFVFTFDREGRFLYVNQPLLDLWGMKLEDALGKTFLELKYPEELAARLQGQVQEVFATGQKVAGETEYISTSGVRGYYEYFFCPVISPGGAVELVAGLSIDITHRKAVEKHLAQTEARYRGLLEAAPDGMVVVNQRGDIVLLNSRAERQFRYWRDELIGQKVKSIIPQGFAERLVADGTRTAAEALAQQIGMGIELTGRRKDGSEFPIEIMLSPLESAEGILVTAAIRDISVRKEAERHLAQMEGKYRGLLEAAPDGMVVVNQSGEIVLLNAQAEKQFGYQRNELLGQIVKSIIPEGFAERLIADGTRTAAEALAQQIGTGIELTGRCKDGSEFPIEIMLSPLDSAEGILVTAAIRDISVRKKAERHLVQTEGKYRGLLEAAPDGMVVVNQSGEIVLLNAQAEKQFGYQRDELLGQIVKSIIPEGFAERLIADGTRTAAEALAQQIGTGIELTGRRKDGSEFPIEIMLSPLDSAEGILVTAAIRDITIRKDAEADRVQKIDELNRSNEELEQFAYVASHDLQEPLRMVASYTQLLSRRYKGKLDSDADEFISFAVDGANRMQRLIQDLLTYSRVGKRGLELRDVSCDQALQTALKNLSAVVEERGALVTHDPLPEVKADETQLVQLFQNLVGNAIKYQGPGISHVHISAQRSGAAKWTLSVQDTGLGISPEFFERIFGMFQRLHKRGEFEGTGMGLAICKKIVERHGGSIWVESKPGAGSTFLFTLAAADRQL
jgi:PAS domain S-box-containing protein